MGVDQIYEYKYLELKAKVAAGVGRISKLISILLPPLVDSN